MHSQVMINIMKKITFCLMTAFVFFVLTSSQFIPETNNNNTSTISLGISNTIEWGDVNAVIAPMNDFSAMGLPTIIQPTKDQYGSAHLDYDSSKQVRENFPIPDGGNLIVIIMLVFLY